MPRALRLLVPVLTILALPARAANGGCVEESDDATGGFLASLSALFASNPDDGAIVTLGSDGCHFDHPAAPRVPSSPFILYVNGVATDRGRECHTLARIRDYTGKTVVGVFNASDGLVRDSGQAADDLLENSDGPLDANPATDVLVDYLARVPAGAKVQVLAFSQGATITSNALARLASTGHPIDGLDVSSFGGAGRSWPDGPHYRHYLHSLDPIPGLIGLGRFGLFDRFDVGKDATVIRFSGTRERACDSFSSRQPLALPSLAVHDVLSVYLERWADDHRLFGPGGRVIGCL